MKIPSSEKALIIRTGFSDDDAWTRLERLVSAPADPFVFNMDIVDDPANGSATLKQLLEALPEDYPDTFVVVADDVAMSQAGYPLIIVDRQSGRQFRAIANQVAAIENNLSLGNMGFDEFLELAGDDAIFRGIAEI